MEWNDATFVAFDLETTGKYPLESEICEVAGVKYSKGRVVDEFQSFIKPSKPMSEEVIAIHNITNEMVAEAPSASEVLPRFHGFLGDAIGVAHHAPFDMGFLAVGFESLGMDLPLGYCLCSALLSRKALPTAPNHRLQTLIRFLNLPQGAAHRALDDAQACLGVALASFNKIGAHASIEQILKVQGKDLSWSKYSVESLKEREPLLRLIGAISRGEMVSMTYQGGSRPGRAREVKPVGVVRNPDGDFLVAYEPGYKQPKRYLLTLISKVESL